MTPSEDRATITNTINPTKPVTDELNEQDLEKVAGGLSVNGPLGSSSDSGSGSGSDLRKSSGGAASGSFFLRFIFK
jgi:hypothetical protein